MKVFYKGLLFLEWSFRLEGNRVFKNDSGGRDGEDLEVYF